ncbi:hypothetical protein ANACOL_02735 [Anaerotruncus colihominis DSM 17241]|uniref:Uncharacterized protein n=1 Tax=Anaerotruncus colihominis DSM 17241 TaxID=445972 RepID=B0PDV0_9FIRM|nr:hypothetical protein ANACOL_02735 [Anaerotruncus colihominis DSM 17241]
MCKTAAPAGPVYAKRRSDSKTAVQAACGLTQKYSPRPFKKEPGMGGF